MRSFWRFLGIIFAVLLYIGIFLFLCWGFWHELTFLYPHVHYWPTVQGLLIIWSLITWLNLPGTLRFFSVRGPRDFMSDFAAVWEYIRGRELKVRSKQ